MRVRILGLLIVGVVVAGCGGQRYARQMNQLESNVGVLDQRVGQLEHTAMTPSATSPAWPMDAAVAPPAPDGAASAPSAPAPAAKPSKKEIQRALKQAGFYQGPIDGKIGPQTREAIRQFQQANGLTADGVVGKRTWEQLSAHLEASAESGEAWAAEPVK